MRALFLIFSIFSFAAQGQALRDINYSYLYNNSNAFTFNFSTVRTGDQWDTFYVLNLTDTLHSANTYTIELETRKSLSEKEGTGINSENVTQKRSSNTITGTVLLSVSEQPLVLTARVINTTLQRAWYFHTLLQPKHPEVTQLLVGDEPMVRNFAKTTDPITVTGESRQIVSYYNDQFPPAALPFSEKLGRVSKGMRVDSSFSVQPGEQLFLNKTGLYLLQTDTLAAEGIAFRLEEDYPRYAKVENLAEPLIYICTSQEFDRMKEAKGDKRAFDRVILSITRDAERAKVLMRNYFRRVEMANSFFTSYKEGWKTDRGMIFIIFGPPTEVFRFNDREVWNYKNDELKLNFDFVHSPSIFDPDNFVLIRNKKYTQTWYQVIDLWRNARF